jgi:uncharacterized membrane protein
MLNRSGRPKTFLTGDEKHKVVEAIRAAEAQTSGEIRVHLDRHCKGAPVDAARFTFDRLGMHATREKNGVLIYLAVHDRLFAVVGDAGLEGKVDAGFWDGVRDRMGKAFAEDKFGDGLAGAIGEIGAKMAAAFPHTAADVNTLRDDISIGRS